MKKIIGIITLALFVGVGVTYACGCGCKAGLSKPAWQSRLGKPGLSKPACQSRLVKEVQEGGTFSLSTHDFPESIFGDSI